MSCLALQLEELAFQVHICEPVDGGLSVKWFCRSQSVKSATVWILMRNLDQIFFTVHAMLMLRLHVTQSKALTTINQLFVSIVKLLSHNCNWEERLACWIAQIELVVTITVMTVWPGLQVIFFWAYVTRHICCCFDSLPSLRQALPKAQLSGAEHQIALSSAQQGQVSKDSMPCSCCHCSTPSEMLSKRH